MLGNLSGIHIVIIVAVILVLFGATKLPLFAKGLGQSIRIFKNEVTDQGKEAKPQATSAEEPTVSEPRTPGASSR